jgi:hypothetical protein
MSVNAICFAFGLAAGFALFGIVLKTLWRDFSAQWTVRGLVTKLKSRRL